MRKSTLSEQLDKLPYFLAIIDHKSMARAAAALRISQPALTRCVKVLEDALGARLFLRTSRGVEVTEAGKRLEGYARPLIAEATRVQSDIRLGSDSQKVSIVIGMKEAVGIGPWAKWQSIIEASAPDIKVDLVLSRSNSELLSALISEKIQMAILPYPGEREGIRSIQIAEETFAFAHHSALKPKAALARSIMLFSSAICSGGLQIGEVVNRSGMPGSLFKNIESYSVIQSFVDAGLGVGLFPLSMISKKLLSGEWSEINIAKLPKTSFGKTKLCVCVLEKHASLSFISTVTSLLKNASPFN